LTISLTLPGGPGKPAILHLHDAFVFFSVTPLNKVYLGERRGGGCHFLIPFRSGWWSQAWAAIPLTRPRLWRGHR